MSFITYPLNMDDYTAEDAELFHCTRNSGIYADDDFQCIASGVDNTITVGEGIGWIRNSKYSGKVFANKTAEVVDLGLADASLPRYDVIAIQFNKAQNLTKIVVKNGTPASSPTIPERSVTESIYELYLCKVYRPVGAVTITADNVTDTRLDAELCGLMADSVTNVDTSAINAQIKALIANLEAEIQGVKDKSGLMHTSDWAEDGAISIEKGGTGATTAKQALYNLGGMSMELLWENASPASEFPAQIISKDLNGNPLDLSKYDFVGIVYHDYLNSDTEQFITVRIGKNVASQYFRHIQLKTEAPYIFERICGVETDKIVFDSACMKISGNSTLYEDQNAALIPLVIYGFKGVKSI